MDTEAGIEGMCHARVRPAVTHSLHEWNVWQGRPELVNPVSRVGTVNSEADPESQTFRCSNALVAYAIPLHRRSANDVKCTLRRRRSGWCAGDAPLTKWGTPFAGADSRGVS